MDVEQCPTLVKRDGAELRRLVRRLTRGELEQSEHGVHVFQYVWLGPTEGRHANGGQLSLEDAQIPAPEREVVNEIASALRKRRMDVAIGQGFALELDHFHSQCI